MRHNININTHHFISFSGVAPLNCSIPTRAKFGSLTLERWPAASAAPKYRAPMLEDEDEAAADLSVADWRVRGLADAPDVAAAAAERTRVLKKSIVISLKECEAEADEWVVATVIQIRSVC